MVWGILGALDEEVALLKESMEVREERIIYGTTYYLGTLHGKEAILACCGIGKVNAALCAHIMLHEMEAGLLINVGIAGAVAESLSVLDVVIGNEVLFHDFDEALLQKFYPYASRFQADKGLLTLCEKACESLGDVHYSTGRIVSGDVFVEDKALRDSIQERFSPKCVEMEGAAIAEVAFMNDKPFLVVRTMSDTAQDDAAELYDNFYSKAADQSARILLKMLELS